MDNSITFEQARLFKNKVLRARPYAQRISFALSMRLAQMYADRGAYFDVLAELDFLEGFCEASPAVAATQFKHPPLYPLWHKHFSTARHLVRNLIIRWGLDSGGNRDLDKLIREVAEEYGDDPNMWPMILAHRLTVDGFEDRACMGAGAVVRECQSGEKRERGLTGDWIIYGKHSGQNYYLDLASHAEGEHPEELYEKLRKGCAAEFPFLFEP